MCRTQGHSFSQKNGHRKLLHWFRVWSWVQSNCKMGNECSVVYNLVYGLQSLRCTWNLATQLKASEKFRIASESLTLIDVCPSLFQYVEPYLFCILAVLIWKLVLGFWSPEVSGAWNWGFSVGFVLSKATSLCEISPTRRLKMVYEDSRYHN